MSKTLRAWDVDQGWPLPPSVQRFVPAGHLALFVQALRLCQAAGRVKLGNVAVDGTKLRANASKHNAMCYALVVRHDAKLTAEVRSWLERAEVAVGASRPRHPP